MPFPSPVPMDYPLVLRAAEFAARAHATQIRKFGPPDPYIVHLFSVAAMVAQRTLDPHVIAAAILHDVVEDQPVTHEDIFTLFGARISALVRDLTDIYTTQAYPQFKRDIRKQMEAARYEFIHPEAKLIK